MKADQMLQALENTIAKNPSGGYPGSWKVSCGDDYVQLVWSCGQDETPEMYGDEPWAQWGGNDILESAGIGDYDDSGCDGYQDKFGDHMVEQWVQWDLEDEENDDE